MRKNIILLTMACLLIMGCGGTSEPENVLKKGIEALHNNDIEGVKQYFDLDDGDLERVKEQMDENRQWIWDQVEIQRSVVRASYDGKKDSECYVLAKVTMRNQNTSQGEFRLNKKEDGKWKITFLFEEDPLRFVNDITEREDTPKGKHPILGNVLNTYQSLDTRFMEKGEIEEALKADIEEIIGNEIPIGTSESQGIRFSKAVVHSVTPAGKNDLSILFNLTPEDLESFENYLNKHRSNWTGRVNGAFIYYTFDSDEGVLKASVSSCYRPNEILALLQVHHNRVGMWKRLKYINMIDSQTYQTLSRRR